jgi:hypothetical protein
MPKLASLLPFFFEFDPYEGRIFSQWEFELMFPDLFLNENERKYFLSMFDLLHQED